MTLKFEKEKSISTVPRGVWESSHIAKDENKTTPTSDLQGNGYPIKIQKNISKTDSPK